MFGWIRRGLRAHERRRRYERRVRRRAFRILLAALASGSLVLVVNMVGQAVVLELSEPSSERWEELHQPSDERPSVLLGLVRRTNKDNLGHFSLERRKLARFVHIEAPAKLDRLACAGPAPYCVALTAPGDGGRALLRVDPEDGSTTRLPVPEAQAERVASLRVLGGGEDPRSIWWASETAFGRWNTETETLETFVEGRNWPAIQGIAYDPERKRWLLAQGEEALNTVEIVSLRGEELRTQELLRSCRIEEEGRVEVDRYFPSQRVWLLLTRARTRSGWRWCSLDPFSGETR